MAALRDNTTVTAVAVGADTKRPPAARSEPHSTTLTVTRTGPVTQCSVSSVTSSKRRHREVDSRRRQREAELLRRLHALAGGWGGGDGDADDEDTDVVVVVDEEGKARRRRIQKLDILEQALERLESMQRRMEAAASHMQPPQHAAYNKQWSDKHELAITAGVGRGDLVTCRCIPPARSGQCDQFAALYAFPCRIADFRSAVAGRFHFCCLLTSAVTLASSLTASGCFRAASRPSHPSLYGGVVRGSPSSLPLGAHRSEGRPTLAAGGDFDQHVRRLCRRHTCCHRTTPCRVAWGHK